MKNQHDRGRRDGQFVLSTPTEVENELPFQLFGAGCDFYQYPIDRPFGFPSFQWIQTIRGRGAFEAGSVRCEMSAGHGLLLYPDEPHRYFAIEEPWYVHWISFNGTNVASMLHYVDMTASGCYPISDDAVIATRIRKALSVLGSDYPFRGVDGSVVVYQLLLDFLKYVQQDGSESRDSRVQRLKPALELIEAELHHPLTLDDLSASIGVTPQYFCEIFRSLTRHRPMEYVNQRRIDRAKELLLKEPATRIHDIAHRVGFENDSYFSTVFRRYEGVSPRMYRETNAGNSGV